MSSIFIESDSTLYMEEIDLRKILSSNIKHYRSLRGWSQVKLAEKLEISTNFLADIETGKSWVSSLTLVKLANCFNIDVYKLFMPKNIKNDELKEAIKSFVNDVSVSLGYSLEKFSKKYISQ